MISTKTAVTELMQWAGRSVCGSPDAQTHPQPSKPAGSRNAVHPRRQHQGSDEHRQRSE